MLQYVTGNIDAEKFVRFSSKWSKEAQVLA